MRDEKISQIIQRLWDLNDNKLIRNVDYQLNLQDEVVDSGSRKHAKSHAHRKREEDDDDDDDDQEFQQRITSRINGPLISYLNTRNILARPTFRTFVQLFDNYTPEENIPEEETDEEEREEMRFLNAIMNTNVMKETHRFLVEEGKAPDSEEEFKEFLDNLWFKFYSRSQNENVEGSSAFEHVFIGELRGKKTVLGCHNWIDYFYLQQKKDVTYHGYLPSDTIYDDSVETDEPGLVGFRFSYDGVLKPMGGFLVGVSPEFEMALYTIVYLCGRQKTKIEFANLSIVLQCFKMQRNGETVLGTLFPSTN